MRASISLLALVGFTLAACEKPAAERKPDGIPAAVESLPLSPGVQAASLVSGGIAGLSDLVQVTHNWKLLVSTSDRNFVRRVTADEQKALREVLKGFATLHLTEGNEPGVADGMGTIIAARGWGTGEGTKEAAQALSVVLGEMRAVAPTSEHN